MLGLRACSSTFGHMSIREYLTSAQAAGFLGVHRRTLTRWVASGRIVPLDQLPGIRGAYLFDPAEVERVAAQRGAA